MTGGWSARSRCTTLADDHVIFDGGGLGRKISVYRLPEQNWSRRVTQSDGHQAWSSPIYLIA